MNIAENEKKYLEIINRHIENGVVFYTSHGVVIEESVKIGKAPLLSPVQFCLETLKSAKTAP